MIFDADTYVGLLPPEPSEDEVRAAVLAAGGIPAESCPGRIRTLDVLDRFGLVIDVVYLGEGPERAA